MRPELIRIWLGVTLVTLFLVTSQVERAFADPEEAMNLLYRLTCPDDFRCDDHTRQLKKRKLPRLTAEQIEMRQNVQSALTSFGFHADQEAEGSWRHRRLSIGQYQTYMGWAATGFMKEPERDILLNSWRRLVAGEGVMFPQTMATIGPRGLLDIERDPAYPAQFGDLTASRPVHPPEAGTQK